MNQRLLELSKRRLILVTRAANQRTQLGDVHRSLEESLAWMRAGFRIARSIRAHPQIIVISMLTIFLTFGRGIPRIRVWLGRAISLYQLSRFLRSKYLSR